ncbi:hypothetical protein Plhal304r1_c010g0039931 [Plasmopara halstedii]
MTRNSHPCIQREKDAAAASIPVGQRPLPNETMIVVEEFVHDFKMDEVELELDTCVQKPLALEYGPLAGLELADYNALQPFQEVRLVLRPGL